MRDACQEVANVAMGRAADLLAKLLDVFVLLPIPNVNVLEVSELTMALKATEESPKISALCQALSVPGLPVRLCCCFTTPALRIWPS